MGGWRDMLDIGVGFEFLDEVSRKLKVGHWAVVAALDEEWATPLDSRMESIGGIVVRSRREHFCDDQLRGELKSAMADVVQYETDRDKFPEHDTSRLKARVRDARAKLERVAERTETRLGRLRREMEAEVEVLRDPIEDTADAKFRKDNRITAVTTQYEARSRKLTETLDAARAMLA